jgi:hypothetical protein
MEEHQNYNLTGSRQQFGGKNKAVTQKKKLKIWVNAIKLIVNKKFSIQEVCSNKDHGQ